MCSALRIAPFTAIIRLPQRIIIKKKKVSSCYLVPVTVFSCKLKFRIPKQGLGIFPDFTNNISEIGFYFTF